MRKENELQEEKRSGAMKIFEALSSVDEELLVRSERREKVIPFRKYTKVMAACMCFVVVGVVAYTSTRLHSSEENASADSAAPAAMEEAAVEEAVPAEEVTTADDKAVAMKETVREEVDAEELPAEPEMSQQSAESGLVEDTTKIENAYEQLAGEKESLLDQGEKLPPEQDEATLRATQDLGDYIPTKLPTGYVFESGYGIDENNPESGISLLWANGMDTIYISISEYVANAEMESRMVDVSDPASYDEHLYEIPYCDSVPEKYYMTFNYPIFKESDFSFEIVEARMKSVPDQGDTDTPRGNFAILYDSGILLEFSGRGDAESIWEMFASIER